MHQHCETPRRLLPKHPLQCPGDHFTADEILETQGTWLRSGPAKNSDGGVHSSTVCSGQDVKAAWVTIEGWMEGRLRCVCVVEYCSAMQRSGMMPFAATWMALEIIVLGGVGQTEQDGFHVVLLVWQV